MQILKKTVFSKSGLMIFWVAVISILSLFNISYARNTHQIKEGILDLRHWDFSIDGNVELSGKWKFYWSEHFEPQTFISGEDKADFTTLKVPGSWNGHIVNGQKIPGTGYATYRLTVLLSGKEKRLALKILDMATAYRIFMNGTVIDEAGTPGKSRESTTAFYHPKVIEFPSTSDRLDIFVHISNFDHWQGGIWESLFLGTPEHIYAAWENKLVITVFLLGGILIIGIYHFFLFGFRPQDKSTLFFGIFCLLIAARIFFTGERFIIHLIPGISFELVLKTIYISFYLCVPIFAMYLRLIFPDEISGKIVKLTQGAGLCFSVFTLLLPSRVYTFAMPVYQALTILVLLYGVWVIFSAAVRKRKGSFIFALGMALLFLSVGNDILYTRQIINTWHLVPVGLLFFIISQAILISKKFSTAFSQVEKSEEQYRSLIEQSTDGICIIQDVQIKYYNSAFLELTGESDEALLNTSFNRFIAQVDREKVLRRYHEKLAGTAPSGRYTVRGQNTKGTLHDLELDAALVEWKEKPSVLVVVRNITEYKKTQELLIQSEKMLSVGGLAAGMAHEINNPLAGMIQNAGLMGSRLTNIKNSANQKAAEEIGIQLDDIHAFMKKRGILKMIKAINESGVRAAEIINNMLSFARKGDASFLKYEPNLLLDKSLELAMTDYDLKKKFDFKKIDIVKEYEENLPMISCEGGKIQQVLLNILRNGSYAMQKKTEQDKNYRPKFILRLSKNPDESLLSIEIEDNGPGMDSKTKKRIFEPFFTTKPMGEGTGLGLSVSYFIITENHGGTMRVVSEPEKGTNFIIQLPLAEEKDR